MPLHRIHHPVFVWVPNPGEPPVPPDPGWGINLPVAPDNSLPGTPPVDPGYGRPGWGPVDPGYGYRPPVDPGYGVPVRPPHVGIKPPGRPVVPSNPIYTPPAGHPWLPGHWEPVDPGYGKPPVWGFIPVDPGFGVPEGGGEAPGQLPSGPGHWVPTDPDYGVPAPPCPSKPRPPLWVWIAEIGPGFGVLPAPTPEPK